ncbi:hypothetical protein J4468_01435 [Candidatus Woesearchaeota archaeon]|nr:hypothetical protein [Candidatus Woesearchaeota archaeon]
MKEVIFLTIVIILLFLSGCSNTVIEGRNLFAKCLTENDVVMYGTEWCPHCKNQKSLFGESFLSVNYIDCDEERQKCIDAGIKGYPTWVIGGKLYPGMQKLETLGRLGGCSVE